MAALEKIIEALGEPVPAPPENGPSAHTSEATPAPAFTPVEELEAALAEGRALRQRLLLEEPGHWGEDGEFVAHDPVPLRDDPLYLWARNALGVLARHFPDQADAFYPEASKGMADSYFGAYFTDEARKVGRPDYLERQITFFSRLLERVR
jgi:hypothetical protein